MGWERGSGWAGVAVLPAGVTLAGLPTASAPPVSASGTARLYFDSTTNTIKSSLNGAAYADIGGGVAVASGSGTTNRLMKFDASDDAADSLLSDDGTNVTLTSGNLLTIGTGSTATMGTGAGTATLVGVANVNTTVVGNVDAGEDNLMTYSLPANSLSANGKAVRVTAWGTTANNGNAKTLKGYFGTSVLANVSLATSQGNFWRITMVVVRTGAATQVAYGDMVGGADGSSYSMSYGTSASPTETLSGAVTIKLTGEGVATNDIVQRGLIVEMLN